MTDRIEEILIDIAKGCGKGNKTFCIDGSEGQPHCFDPRYTKETGYGGEHAKELKQAITEQTLKQVMDLIGEDEELVSKGLGLSQGEVFMPSDVFVEIRNKIRAELRQSAERIWKI